MSVVWGPSKWGEGRPGSRTDSEWAGHPEMEVQEAFHEGAEFDPQFERLAEF